MNGQKQAALAAIEEKKQLVAGVADQIWEYAELSLQEVQPAALYVEQLVDERKQSRALSRHHASHLTDVARKHLSLLKHVRIAEDDGERRAELVGDIGEERDAHLVHLMLQQLLALTGTQGVEHERNNDRGEHDDKHGCGEAEPSKRALCLVLVVDGIHLGAVLLVLVAHAHVLHVYDVLLARHAVAEFVILFIVAQRTCVVALPAVYLVVDTCNLRLVFERAGVPMMENRIAYAQAFYQQFANQ